MAEQGRNGESFERWVEAEGRSFQYPTTPMLAARVAARLQAERGSRIGMPRAFSLPSPRLLRNAVVALLVLAMVVAAVTALASPTARSAMAAFFGLKRVQVVHVEETATAPPSTTGTAVPTTTSRAAFAVVAGGTTMAEAQRRTAFPLRVPTYPIGLGEPGRVYFQDFQPGQQVVLFFKAMPELGLGSGDKEGVLFTLFQFKTEGIFVKMITPGTQLEELRVNGKRALWFQGAAHILQYRDPDGKVRVEFERLVTGNTLAWEEGDVTYRLETTLPKEEAVQIAESLRP